MSDIKLLPLQEDLANWLRSLGVEHGPHYYEMTTSWVEDYARINVEYHTERLRHEVETLRDGLDYLAVMKGVKDVLDLRAKAARAERLEEALRSVERYGADTLSGPTTDPDDRQWYRAGVVEMVRRAQAALRDGESQFPQNSKGE